MAHTFTLTDADGTEHRYEIVAKHKAEAGIKITRQLQALVAGPIGAFIDGKVSDRAALGPELSRALLGLNDAIPPRVLLEHVVRDGVPMFGALYAKSFNDAYQGNYGELDAALIEVIQYNRFLSLPAGMSGVLGSIKAKFGTFLAHGSGTSSEPPRSE